MEGFPCGDLSSQQLERIVRDAKDFALCHGVAMCPRNPFDADSLLVLPVCLFPSPYPKKEYELARSVQENVNKMMHRVALDYDFLSSALKDTIVVDDFTKRMWDIYERVEKEGLAQENLLGLFRSDYMVNEKPQASRQIEVNAISVSFAGLSPLAAKMHHHLLTKHHLGGPDAVNSVPLVRSDTMLAEGLAQAWDCYGKDCAIILVAVENVSINMCDQRYIEYALFDIRPEIVVLRKSFIGLEESAVFRDNALYVDGMEVAVVYYRTAYSPEQFGPQSWDLRYKIEKSKAIKCPSIQHHIAGVKKLQQVLTKRDMLEKFLTDPKEADLVSSTFAKIWGLDFNEEGEQAYNLAMNAPDRYVLKPQREGGGNNFYEKEITEKLMPLKNKTEREAYILMELIKPKPVRNYILRHNSPSVPEPNQVIGELGIFGVIFGNKNAISCNKDAGHVLRTKAVGVNEGGISSGFGALDSPFLV